MYWLAKLCGGWAILWRGRVGGVLSALVVLYCLCWNATSKMIRVVVWCCECGVVVAALAGAPLCLDVESLLCRGIRNVGRLCVLPSAALLDSLSGVAGGWGVRVAVRQGPGFLIGLSGGLDLQGPLLLVNLLLDV